MLKEETDACRTEPPRRHTISRVPWRLGDACGTLEENFQTRDEIKLIERIQRDDGGKAHIFY
ncbi:hypothetical protein [Paraburkholderia gardini]|uniref:hypothetical protein n=1 Tax=Paraburkholderia gardini TaxID=2823469 RepID=UPI001E57E517|nr:hypothetical protein [Paraburkholderia gardini]